MILSLPWPTLKGGYHEQGQHGFGNVVVVEGVSLPHSLLDDGIVEISVLVDDKLTLTGLLSHLGRVRAHEELPLEELDADDAEHEDEQERDKHDVADGLDGDDHALDDMLEAFGTVDGSKGSEHTEDTKNLHHRNSTRTEMVCKKISMILRL